MNARKIGLLAALVVATVGLWYWARPQEKAPAPSASHQAPPAGSTPPASSSARVDVNISSPSHPTSAALRPAPAPSKSQFPTAVPVIAGADPKSPPAAAAPGDIAADLEQVQTALRNYRTALGGNPVGNNEEITRALLGDNLKQIKVPVPPGSAVGATGELMDRWSTPYFFHQLSGAEMEVRSAGPDRQMWTADDLIQK